MQKELRKLLVSPHSSSLNQIYNELESKESGLSEKEATLRAVTYGKNLIPEKKSFNGLKIIWKQINSYLVYILLIAAIISFFFHKIIDVYVIIFVIFVNTLVGFIEEYKAEKAISSLKKILSLNSKVYRDGSLKSIASSNLIPGDIIILEEGDKIPADVRIIASTNFKVNESSLTGESFPVLKQNTILDKRTAFSDRTNMAWMGTFVVSGKAKAIVVSTGSLTAIGKIARDIENIKEPKGHFEKKTDTLAKHMAIIAMFSAILIFLVGYLIRKMSLSEIFLFSVASLISSIPAGLPAVLVIVLAVGAHRMTKKNAVVRKLSSIETLAVVDTIITDKTGTLTQNTMSIEKVYLPGQDLIDISGEGWATNGTLSQSGKNFDAFKNSNFQKFLEISYIGNSSEVIKESNSKYSITGDPTDAAFKVLLKKSGYSINESDFSILGEIPFSSNLKIRASLIDNVNKSQIFVSGAPEEIFSKCTKALLNKSKVSFNEKIKNLSTNALDSLASNGYRVIALAYKDYNSKSNNLSEKDLSDLIFVGLAAMKDPPRKEVKSSIQKAKEAGIRVIMATGDHKLTALSIAEEIGLGDKSQEALTESEVIELSDSDLSKKLDNINVFARLTPQTKLRISRLLQLNGKTIAMTGDGVNDAPALKQADIGISMGLIGTDVARDSSDIVLMDDNFSSIVSAVEEGRTVFSNVRRTSFFLLTTNFAQTLTLIFALLLGSPSLPLLPTQIFWINLVTSGVTDVALAVEPNHGESLKNKPRSKTENILSRDVIPNLLLISILMMAISLTLYFSYLPEGLDKARTIAFVTISLTQLFNIFNMRSLKKSVFKIGFFKNKFLIFAFFLSLLFLFSAIYIPFMNTAFSLVPLKLSELIIIFVLSSTVFLVGEIYKYLRYKNQFSK